MALPKDTTSRPSFTADLWLGIVNGVTVALLPGRLLHFLLNASSDRGTEENAASMRGVGYAVADGAHRRVDADLDP